MQPSIYPLIALMALGISMLGAMVVAFRIRKIVKYSAATVSIAVLPALVMLGLYYSLAIHMHHSLGGWPLFFMGEQGFPTLLNIHAAIAGGYFLILLLVTFFVWPVIFLLCVFIKHWRTGLYYLGIYAFSFVLCFGLMLLAPSRFWGWWID